MRKLLVVLLLLFVEIIGIVSISNATGRKEKTQFHAGSEYSKPLVSFTENKGQITDQQYQPRTDVLFAGFNEQMVFHLRNDGISYQLYQYKNEGTDQLDKFVPQSTTHDIYRIDMNWVGSNKEATISTGQANSSHEHYFNAAIHPEGIRDVRTFNSVRYNEIYPGIDLQWYEKDGQLKYDYLVDAGADYKKIKMEIKGYTSLHLNYSGDLVITTPFGVIIEDKPLVFQDNKILVTNWKLENNLVSFDILNVDPSKEIIIDPSVRLWGTYYGGSGIFEKATAIDTDAAGNVYICGDSPATLGIATSGSHQTTVGGSDDAYLAKFSPTGVRLWATYYGGTSGDYAFACNVDINNDIYLSGYTTSSTGMATAGSHQPTIGGTTDAFLAKFNSSGTRIWATYYGGNLNDLAYTCTSDLAGNVYIAGTSISNTLGQIATAGAHQTVIPWATFADAFLVKFNSAGVRQWGTYYGGTGVDESYGLITDAAGNIYMSGHTGYSSNQSLIATAGAHQTVYVDGYDAFLVKFNASGVRQWGTYYGDFGWETGYSLALDASGNIYMCGRSESATTTAVATVGSHQSTYGGVRDGLIVKFNNSGVRQWATYYGGTDSDVIYSCGIDNAGNLYVCGSSNSSGGTAIATTGSYQPVYNGSSDAFLVKFNASGVRQSGTYFGGDGVENGYGLAIDLTNKLYVAGSSNSFSLNTIPSPGCHQPAKAFGSDGFVIGFAPAGTLPVEASPLQGTNVNGYAQLKWTTFSERENYGFEVERSSNATSWKKTGFLFGQGNSNVVNHYSFIDPEPLDPFTYYRYKQIDYDGQFSYSTPIALTRKSNSNLKACFILKNPGDDFIEIKNLPVDEMSYLYEITDLIGRNILSGSLNSSLGNTITLNAPSGSYLIRILDRDGGFIALPYIKQ